MPLQTQPHHLLGLAHEWRTHTHTPALHHHPLQLLWIFKLGITTASNFTLSALIPQQL
jgi:hypothetical protein